MSSKKRVIAVLLGAFALLAGTGLTTSSAWLITMAASHPPILVLSVSIVLVRFFGISRSGARYAERLYSHESVFSGLTSLRVNLYRQIAASPQRFVRKVETGGLVKSIVDNLERAQEYALRVTLPSRQALVTLFVTDLIALWIYPKLLLVYIPATLALIFILPNLISRTNEQLSQKIELLEDRYATSIESGVVASVEAEIYKFAKPLAAERLDIETEIYSCEERLLIKNRGYQWAVQTLIASTLVASALIATQARTLAPVKISMAIFLPLVAFEAIALWYPNLYQSGKLLRASHSLRELEVEYSSPGHTSRSDTTPHGGIVCVDAQVAWRDIYAEPISFSATSDEIVVIRGESGVGKTTLSMAALGLLEYRGSIKVSGIEVSELNQLDKHISASLQNGHIFNTTVRENLKIGNPDASDAEMQLLLNALELDSISLDEMIGEFGRHLSGGEAKRISVARAVISAAPTVLLDEPTEHLDSELASRMEGAISNYCRGRTLIVITHSGWLNSTKEVTLTRE